MSTESSLFSQTMAMWREVDFSVASMECPRTLEYVAALAALYSNGEVLHRAFQLPKHPLLQSIVSSGDLLAAGFFERLWRFPIVQQELPYELAALNFYSRNVFDQLQSLMLSGSLAVALAEGGAYSSRYAGGSSGALALAEAAATELIDKDYERVRVFVSHEPWCSCFHDVAWDETWVVVHPGHEVVHVLLATDTD